MSTDPLTVSLPSDFLDQIAARVIEILDQRDRADASPEPWLNVEQAAAHLGLSKSQLYQLCHRRSSGIPVVKDGSRSYFRASELDVWRLGNASTERPHHR